MRAIEKRERQLDQALAAVNAQREQLAAIQADYERRRQGLIERAREVQTERERLHAERGRDRRREPLAEAASTLKPAGR